MRSSAKRTWTGSTMPLKLMCSTGDVITIGDDAELTISAIGAISGKYSALLEYSSAKTEVEYHSIKTGEWLRLSPDVSVKVLSLRRRIQLEFHAPRSIEIHLTRPEDL